GRETWRARARALACEDIALHLVPSGAAIFLGPAWCDPTLRKEDLLPGKAVARIGEDARGTPARIAQLRRERRFEESAHLIAKGEVFGREFEIHLKRLLHFEAAIFARRYGAGNKTQRALFWKPALHLRFERRACSAPTSVALPSLGLGTFSSWCLVFSSI